MSNFINKENFPNEVWLTSDEVMLFFKISKSTLWRWNRDQQLPRCLVGGTHYYPKHFIEKFMMHKLMLPPNFKVPRADDGVRPDTPNQPPGNNLELET